MPQYLYIFDELSDFLKVKLQHLNVKLYFEVLAYSITDQGWMATNKKKLSRLIQRECLREWLEI